MTDQQVPGTLHPLAQNPSYAMEINSSDNCTALQCHHHVYQALKKIAFWNRNDLWDKVHLLSVLPAEAG